MSLAESLLLRSRPFPLALPSHSRCFYTCSSWLLVGLESQNCLMLGHFTPTLTFSHHLWFKGHSVKLQDVSVLKSSPACASSCDLSLVSEKRWTLSLKIIKIWLQKHLCMDCCSVVESWCITRQSSLKELTLYLEQVWHDAEWAFFMRICKWYDKILLNSPLPHLCLLYYLHF